MKTLSIFLGIALTTTYCGSAMARENSVYVELDAGLTQLDKTNADIGTTTDAASAKHKIGYDLGGVIGYDFGTFRLEAEASFRNGDANNVTSSVRLPNGAPISSANPGASGSFNNVTGSKSAQSLMANALLDIGSDDKVQFFVGGGVGLARVKHSYAINSAGPAWLSGSVAGSDNAYGKFAWQAIAGLRAPIGSNLDVGVKYRFFNVGGGDLVDSSGRAVATDGLHSHSIMASIAYSFGGKSQ